MQPTIRLAHPLWIFLILFVADMVFNTFRSILWQQSPSNVRKARECLHSYTPTDETDDQFFNRMWSAMPYVVEHCSNKYFRHRTSVFGDGQMSFKWLNWQVDVVRHKCNVVFFHRGTDLTGQRALKTHTKKCFIYSVSQDFEEQQHFQDKQFSVLTIRENVVPSSEPVYLGPDLLPRESDSVSLIYYLLVDVHVFRYDLLNFYYDGKEHIKSLFTKSLFDDAKLSACQVNVIYDRPKNKFERREFRTTWKRLLYDRRYLVTSVQRIDKGNRLKIFLLNISDNFCWSKYVSNQPLSPKMI